MSSQPGFLVAHACNPSYWGSGGRRTRNFRLDREKVATRPFLKNKIKTKRLEVWLKWYPGLWVQFPLP
jgi:hypothetical protein